jgi:hypothetical protein
MQRSIWSAVGAIVIVVSCVAPAAGQRTNGIGDAEVTIPLNEYDQLRRQNQEPSLVVIESFSVQGALAADRLSLHIAGRATGLLPEIELFRARNLGGISSCRGEAILRPRATAIGLKPLDHVFNVECRLHVAQAGRIEFDILEPVLFVEAVVEDGEAFVQETGDGARRVVLSRRSGAGNSQAIREVSGVGRYRISIEPDMTRFVYLLEFENPNRTATELVVPLRNQETLRIADGDAVITEEEAALRLGLAPGTNRVRIEGALFGSSFAPPLDFDEQYMIVEHHPMLRVEVSTGSPRISPRETGIEASGRNGRAFLMAGDDVVEWTSEKMEVFEAQGFTVPDADYLVYVPGTGRAVVEAHFVIDSPGGQELPLVVDGRPTFLEIDGQAQPLYRSEDHRLTVPLAQGKQSVTVQYQTGRSYELLEVLTSLPLVGVAAPVSTTSIVLRVHSKWRILGAAFSRSLWTPVGFGGVVFRVLVCVGVLVFARRGGAGVVVAVFLAMSAFLLSLWSWLWLAPVVAAGVLWAALRVDPTSQLGRVLRGPMVGAVVFVGGLILIGAVAVSTGGSPSSPDLLSGTQRSAFAKAVGTLEEGVVPQALEGAPARIEIPARGRDVRFQEDLVSAGERLGIGVLLAPKVGLDLLLVLVLVTLGIVLWIQRRRLAEIYRTAWPDRHARPWIPVEEDARG